LLLQRHRFEMLLLLGRLHTREERERDQTIRARRQVSNGGDVSVPVLAWNVAPSGTAHRAPQRTIWTPPYLESLPLSKTPKGIRNWQHFWLKGGKKGKRMRRPRRKEIKGQSLQGGGGASTCVPNEVDNVLLRVSQEAVKVISNPLRQSSIHDSSIQKKDQKTWSPCSLPL